MNNDKIKIVNNAGQEIICDILFTYKDDKTGKNYIVYTDRSFDAKGVLKAYGAIYHPENPNLALEPISNLLEWKKIQTILETIQNNQKG